MADITLAERGPLAHCITPGRHGRMEDDAGVTLRVLPEIRIVMLLGRKLDAEGLRAAAEAAGAALPAAGAVTAGDGFAVLWAGPDQWLVAAQGRQPAADRFVQACLSACAVVDQSDGRAVIEVGGPKARAALAKGVPVDLHPRSFKPGTTALTTAAAVAIQIWQTDDAPTYRIAVPRSFAEAFWRWLVEAAAEYVVMTDVGD